MFPAACVSWAPVTPASAAVLTAEPDGTLLHLKASRQGAVLHDADITGTRQVQVEFLVSADDATCWQVGVM